MSTATEAKKWTEAGVLNLLRERHAAQAGNGPEWAYMEKVRNRSGFDATRTADAMALSLWPSRGHELHGYEVKVSRSDWRSELKDGAKADAWHGIVDRWWIAAPSGVVPRDELPATWGLIEASNSGKLRVAVQAPLLTTERATIKRDLLVPILRAAGAGLSCTPEQAALDEARAKGRKEGMATAKRAGTDWQKLYEDTKANADAHFQAVTEIERALGTSIRAWAGDKERVTKVAAALRLILAQELAVEYAKRATVNAIRGLEQAAKSLRGTAGLDDLDIS